MVGGASWAPLGSGVDGVVDALSVFDDGTGPALYAGGNFQHAPADFGFRWSPQAGAQILPSPAGFNSSLATGIAADGRVVGSTDSPAPGGPYAVLWNGTVPLNLGTMPEGNFSRAEGINSNGVVVGTWGNNVTGRLHGFAWANGVMTSLAGDLGTPHSEASDINDKGQIVGWMGDGFTEHSEAFMLHDGAVTVGLVPALPPTRGDAQEPGHPGGAGRLVTVARVTAPPRRRS